ncbi:MAG: hypothetical protein D8M59_05950 [Planctomycetes bacterium]|nr:hypothetical protein [Planctomycetota bacterium]NOG55874.1 hypothetical protein [Planctomycetota bacterium]
MGHRPGTQKRLTTGTHPSCDDSGTDEPHENPDTPDISEETSGTIADRRVVPDRRWSSYTKTTSGLERRRGPGRRRSDNVRSAEEGEMTTEQFLFLMAINAFKSANGKTFPTWTDVLEIVRRLGYRKVQPSEIQLRNAEDWLEPPDAPARSGAVGSGEISREDPDWQLDSDDADKHAA